MLRGELLSEGVVSWLVGYLEGEFERWRARHLAEEDVRYLYLQGLFAKVRIGWRQVRAPVLVRLGVCEDGRQIVIDMRLGASEAAQAWGEVIPSLVERRAGAGHDRQAPGLARGSGETVAEAQGVTLHGAHAL